MTETWFFVPIEINNEMWHLIKMGLDETAIIKIKGNGLIVNEFTRTSTHTSVKITENDLKKKR